MRPAFKQAFLEFKTEGWEETWDGREAGMEPKFVANIVDHLILLCLHINHLGLIDILFRMSKSM